MNKPVPVPESASQTAERTPFRARIPKYTIRFLALLGMVLLLWKVIAVSVLESEHADALEALRDSTARQIAARTDLLVRATGEATASALLPVLRGGDQARLAVFASELTRRMGTRDYILADAQGIVRAATSAAMIGQPLDANLQRAAGTLDAALADDIGNGVTRVIIPLRDQTGRAGTLILTWRFGD